LADAVEQVTCWLEIPSLVLLSEDSGYWEHLQKLIRTGRIQGPMVHDARVAALCLQHGVQELWSADSDFSRIQELVVKNPLLGSPGGAEP
jgi:predicted nucleic acid-binding protein